MKNKFKAFISMAMCFILLFSVFPATYASAGTAVAAAPPLGVSITANKSNYSTTGFASISVTVTNTGSDTLNAITVESILPNTLLIFGTDHLISKADSLAPGGKVTTSFEVCLNPSKAKIDLISKLLLNAKISSKKKSIPKTAAGTGAAQVVPGAFSFAFDTTKSLVFGKITATQTVRVSYKISTAGSLQGSVIDALTGAKIVSANVTTYRTSASNVNYEKISHTVTDSAGAFKLILVAGTYSVTVTKAGYVSLIQYSVTVTADKATSLSGFKFVPGAITTSGQAGGTIKNLVTGGVLPGVTVKFRTGLNNKAGGYFKNSSGVDISATTDSSGVYTVTLPLGNYTAELSLSGYATGYINIFSLSSGTNRDSQNGTLKPVS